MKNFSFPVPAGRVCLWSLLAGLMLVVGAGCSKQSKIDRHLQRADEYYGKGDYEKAIIEYQNVRQLDRQNQKVVRQMALSFLAQGKVREAYFAFQEAVRMDPNDDQSRLKHASLLLLSGDYEAAETNALWVLEKDANHLDALRIWAGASQTPEQIATVLKRLTNSAAQIQDQAGYHLLLGTMLWRHNELDAAEQALKTAQKLAPTNSQIGITLGDFYRAKKETDLAEKEFAAVTDVTPTNATALFKIAELKRTSGDLEKSKELLEQILQENPDYRNAQFRLAQIEAAEGHYDKAQEKINLITAKSPDDIPTLELQAKLYLVKGETTNAISALQKYSERYGKVFPQFHYLLSLAYLQGRDTLKALDTVGNAVKAAKDLNPTNEFLQANLLLSELNLRTGKLPEAVASLEDIAKKQPQLTRAHVLLGTAYMAQRQFDKAIATFQTVANLATNSAQADYLLGASYLARTNLAEATQCFEKALAKNPQHYDALARLVDQDLLRQEPDTALQRIRQQMTVTNSPVLHLMLATVYVGQGQAAPAEEEFKKTIALEPRFLKAHHLLAQLYAATRRTNEAIQQIEQARAVATNNIETLMIAASLYQTAARDLNKTREMYEHILALQPNNFLAANNLAALYLEQNDLEKAYPLAMQAYKNTPENSPVRAAVEDTLGWIVSLRGDPQYGLTLLTRSVNTTPQHREIRYHLGMVQSLVGLETEARENLTRALTPTTNNPNVFFPGSADAQLMLKVLAINPDAPSAADQSLLAEAAQKIPNYPSVLFRTARAAELGGHWSNAVPVLERLVENHPAYRPAALALARLYAERLNSPDKAQATLNKLYQTAPDDPAVALALARLTLDRKGDPKWALSLLEKAAAKLGNDPEALYDLARAAYLSGNETRTRAALNQALKSTGAFPRQAEAQFFLEMLGQPTDANRIKQVLAAKPDLLPAQMAHATLLQRNGDYAALKQAREIYEAILKSSADFAPAKRQLAETLYQMAVNDNKIGNVSEAQTLLDLALKADPGFPHAREANRLREDLRRKKDTALPR